MSRLVRVLVCASCLAVGTGAADERRLVRRRSERHPERGQRTEEGDRCDQGDTDPKGHEGTIAGCLERPCAKGAIRSPAPLEGSWIGRDFTRVALR